jgi:3-deoxy-D-manno-octulosonic-acid transferase
LDRRACVQRFLKLVKPRALVVFETEIWPHWLVEIDAPVWFANARLSDTTVSRLSPFKRSLAPIWKNVRLVFAQTALDAHRFVLLGLPPDRARVAGQVKQFDLSIGPGQEERSSWRKRLGLSEQDRLFVAGSIRHDELRTVLSHYRSCCSEDRRPYLALAPRHLKYVGQAERSAWELGFRTRRISGLAGHSDGAQVFILDSHGDLPTFYAAADLALLGGTFAPHGGHDPNEAARFGVPVLTGPHTQKIDGDLALLAEADLAYRMECPSDLPVLAASLVRFNRARARHVLQDLLAVRPHPARLLADSVQDELGG